MLAGARLLGQNSGNSSLPPSADRGKKPARPQRRGSGRKPGKQPGAPGSALEMVADPDEVIEHVPAACTGCGDDLHDAEPAGVVVRQVRDVPLVKVRVTEHRHAPAGLRLRLRDHRAGAGRGGRAGLLWAEPARDRGVPGGVPARAGRAGRAADRRPDRRRALDRVGQRPGRPRR